MRRLLKKVNIRACLSTLLAVSLLTVFIGGASAHYLGQRQVQQQVILQPMQELPSQLAYLLPEGQDVILQDWSLEQGKEMQFIFPVMEDNLTAEVKAGPVAATITVVEGQANLILQLEETAEVISETPVCVAVTGEKARATFYTMLLPGEAVAQPDEEPSQAESGQHVLSSLKHLTLGEGYWIELNAQEGVTYTLSLSVTKAEGGSAYLTNVRYSLDGGQTYKLQTVGEDIRIPAQVQTVLLDLGFSQLALGDTVSFIVQDGNKAITLNPTVKESRTEGGYVLTENQPILLPETNIDTLQWSVEQLTDGQWQTVPAECFCLTQTEEGLILAIAEDQHLQAGTYRFLASHRVGSMDIPWDQIPVFIQRPLL